MATAETSAVEAVAANRPGRPLASSGGEVASPFESVVAVAWPPPRKLAPAPVAPVPTEKLTVAPCTGLLFTSVTRACSGWAYRLFTRRLLAGGPGRGDRGRQAAGGIGQIQVDGAVVGMGVDAVAARGVVRGESGRGRNAARVRSD